MSERPEVAPGDQSNGHVEQLGELSAKIRSDLVEGAENELQNGHLERIVIRDHHGQEYVHVIPREEAETIDRALWSAGEDMNLDFLTSRIVSGIRASGLDLSQPDHLDLTVHLVESPE